MSNHKPISISIILGAIILSIPLWKISNSHSTSIQNINLPSALSIKQQVKRMGPEGNVNDILYSIDKTKILLDISFPAGEGITYSAVIYKMDEYGRFLREAVPSGAELMFPIEIK